MLATCALLVALAVPASRLFAGPVALDGVVATGAHFQIISDFPESELSKAVIGEALAAAELTWEETGRWIGLPTELDAPLVIHLYREIAGYEAAEDKLTHGQFKRNLSFSSFETKAAYVALQPPLSDVGLERFGLPLLTVRLVAHEAAHLAVYACFKNFESHPGWFAEGFSCHVAEAVLIRLTGVRDGTELPHYASAMGQVQQLAADGKLPSCEAHLLGRTGGLTWSQGYSIDAVFFNYLASKKLAPKLKQVIAELRRLGGGESFSARVLESTQAVFGKSSFAKLDPGFKKYVRKLEPKWDQVYRSLWPQADGSFQQIAFPGKNAIAWRTSGPGKSKWTLVGEIEIVTGQQMNLLFDRSDRGFVSVALVAGAKPNVTVFDFDAKTSDWNRIGDGELTEFPVGGTASFEFKLSKHRLKLTFAGQAVLDIEVAGHDFRGPWGLGAQAGSAGIWKLSKVPK